jgi:hypothetical protein
MTGKRFHRITSLVLIMSVSGLGLVAISLRSWEWENIDLGVKAHLNPYYKTLKETP